MSKSKKMRVYTLDEVIDKHIGKRGSVAREQFEFELKLEQVGDTIRQLRKRRKMTQEELGALIGVQKAQISKLEKDGTNMTIGTLVKVFTALRARFKVEPI